MTANPHNPIVKGRYKTCKNCEYSRIYEERKHNLTKLIWCMNDESDHRGHILAEWHIACERFREREIVEPMR